MGDVASVFLMLEYFVCSAAAFFGDRYLDTSLLLCKAALLIISAALDCDD
jgi:hypothetical protein